MKKALLILAAIAGATFVSCQKENNIEPSDLELTGKTYTLTVEATKAVGTKALAFEGTTLVTSWAATDEVKVCKHGSATAIGTLTPSVAGSATASLSGPVTLTDVNVGDKLDLIFPDTNWTYENQDGTLETISTSFDFARAEVTVSGISGTTLTASDATFTNEQSLVKFTLFDKASLSLIDVNYLTISAASGKLVKSYEVSGDAYTPVYGDLVITPSSGTASEFYVALRNTSGAADTYTLTAQYGLSTYYTFVKSGVTFENGHYRAINVKMNEETDVYTVAGTPVAVFGTEWDTDNTANDMVKQSDGTYRKTYPLDGTEDAIRFKVVRDRDWAYAWGVTGSHADSDGNYFIDLGEITKGTLVITFDPSTTTVNATIESEAYTIAGNDQDIFGASWDPSEIANDMVKQMDDTFLKDYTITSGLVGRTIEFKVAQDHDWVNSWGDGSGNYSYTIPHEGILHISFDPITKDIDAWMDDIRYTIAGDFNSWNVTANPMIKQSDGTYKCEVSIPAGVSISYEYKAVLGETTWIGDPSNGDNNFIISLADLGATVLSFTYTPATNTLIAEEHQVTLYFGIDPDDDATGLKFCSEAMGTAAWPGSDMDINDYTVISGRKYYKYTLAASQVWGMTPSVLIYVVSPSGNWDTAGQPLTADFTETKDEYYFEVVKWTSFTQLSGRPWSYTSAYGVDWYTDTDVATVAGRSDTPYDAIRLLKASGNASRVFLYFEVEKASLHDNASYSHANLLNIYFGDSSSTTAFSWQWTSNYTKLLEGWLQYGGVPSYITYGCDGLLSQVVSHDEGGVTILSYELSIPRSFDACLQGTSATVAMYANDQYTIPGDSNWYGGEYIGFAPTCWRDALSFTLPAYSAE